MHFVDSENSLEAKRQYGKPIYSIKFCYLSRGKIFGTSPEHFSQAILKGIRKSPELHIHTCVTMADLQMKLLRKKIQKRNENRKKRKLLSKQEEQEEQEGAGMWLKLLNSVVD